MNPKVLIIDSQDIALLEEIEGILRNSVSHLIHLTQSTHEGSGYQPTFKVAVVMVAIRRLFKAGEPASLIVIDSSDTKDSDLQVLKSALRRRKIPTTEISVE